MQVVHGLCWGLGDHGLSSQLLGAGHRCPSWVSRWPDPSLVLCGPPWFSGGTKAFCMQPAALVYLGWLQRGFACGAEAAPAPAPAPPAWLPGSALPPHPDSAQQRPWHHPRMETSRMQNARSSVPQHQQQRPLPQCALCWTSGMGWGLVPGGGLACEITPWRDRESQDNQFL